MTAWMEPVLNHLWQSTLFAGACALLALAFRGHQARVRHGIWLAASLTFLVPFGVLAGIGSSYSAIAEPLAPLEVTVALRTATTPFSQPEYTAFPVADAPAAAPRPGRVLPWLLAMGWLLGTVMFVARWSIRWRRLARLRRKATLLDEGREWLILRRLERRLRTGSPLGLAATGATIEPGLFGIVRPVLLWPRAMSTVLDDDQIEAIFAHELCHVRRRDNLTAALHMAVEAIFWFCPMTWWIGARLLRERERACDEWVVARGSEPGVYAESILRTCRFCVESPLACAAGVTGADLRRRIERIISAPPVQALGSLGGAVLLLAALGALVVPVTAGSLMPAGLGLGGSRFMQSPRQTMAFAPRHDIDAAVAARARFSDVSVAPSTSTQSWGSIRPWANGRFTATGATLRELVVYAYSPAWPLLGVKLDGAPPWIESERFDIVARSRRPFANDAYGEPKELTGMIRNMLAERFGLRIHAETREMAVFDLVRVSERASGLRPSSASCWRPQLGPPPAGARPLSLPLCGTTVANPRLSAEAVPMSWLASTLGARMRQVVRDATGLDGRHDVNLSWTPSVPLEPQALGASLREQLGLDLVETTGTLDVLVVTDARRPVTE
jgi:uncharacterized protein (TIGR03435 family)